MKRGRAVTLAIECIQREIKRLAVDANIHDVMGATYPAAIQASARRKELKEAITTLQQPQQEQMKL